MHQSLKRAASFLGWQLVPVRHLGRIRYLRPQSFLPIEPPQSTLALEIDTAGYAAGPEISQKQLEV